MEMGIARLTIFFEEPFWVGLCERQWDGWYEVCKITFGAEPKDGEVEDFFQREFRHLRFSPPMRGELPDTRRCSPKRMQREIVRETRTSPVGTKAQQALKLQYETGKQERKADAKDRREAEAERRFQQRQEKKREKHKGH